MRRTDIYIHGTRDVMHPELGKVKHVAAVQEAMRRYKEAYPRGGPDLKAAEIALNAAVEKALSPK